jgi:hypothetical protein
LAVPGLPSSPIAGTATVTARVASAAAEADAIIVGILRILQSSRRRTVPLMPQDPRERPMYKR